jgi:hypothetical protein
MKSVCEIIENVGLFSLSGYDGCVCGGFAIQGIHVDISCRKSGASTTHDAPNFYGTSLRVYSKSLSAMTQELKAVAELVSKQIRDSNEWTAIKVRFCSWDDDANSKCNYCGEEKPHGGYLCKSCTEKPEAQYYDYTEMDFTIPEAE